MRKSNFLRLGSILCMLSGLVRIVFGFALVFAAIIISEVLPERAKR